MQVHFCPLSNSQDCHIKKKLPIQIFKNKIQNYILIIRKENALIYIYNINIKMYGKLVALLNSESAGNWKYIYKY